MLPLLVAAVAVGQPPARALAVSPAAEGRPALRYELLPPLRDRQPGNAALAYFRAFAVRPKPAASAAEAKAREDAYETWLNSPLDRLPKVELRKSLDESKRLFQELDRAVAAADCDWGTLTRLKAGGIEDIAEVQQSREVMRLLTLRTRLELAEDRFADAAKSLRAGFQMAKHVGEAPTQLQLLVGLALGAITLERVEDWVARPGSPNLYWALTNLPRPLVNPWPGFEGEQVLYSAKLPNLVRLKAGPVPKDEAAGITDRVMGDLANLGGPVEPGPVIDPLEKAVGGFAMAGVVAWKLPTARKELLALGRTATDLDAMPPAQVVFLSSLERFEALRDDYLKWVAVPYHRAWPDLKTLNARVKAERAAGGTDPFFVLLSMALPATEKVMWAVARTDRRVQFLRTVEALRLHAAARGGTPPAKLADIAAVPVPDDPITGKPFGYEVKGTTVVLMGGPPDGEPANAGNSFRYEVTFREGRK